MHPLLVSAVANTASNFLDRWSRGSGAATTEKAAQPFAQVLDGSSATVARRAPSAAQQIQDLAATLRARLMDAPEVRAVIDSSDPTKPTTIEVTPDGKVLATAPGRDPKPLLLSPETAELARDLASLTPARAAITSSAALPKAILAR
jgi:ketosteroid isomerase-like protein